MSQTATTDLGTLFVNLKLRDDLSQQLETAEEKLKKTGKTMEKVGKNFTKYLTLPIMGFGALSIKEFGEFEAAMSKVEATTGATASEMAILTEKARDMGKNTKYSASEAADAMNYMAMAGWDTTQIMDGLDGVMNLAAASGTDLATTSDIVTDALTGFKMSAKDTEKFVDLLANTSRNANTDVVGMGEAFKYVAPIAGGLGITAEETATAIGLMANAGIKGSQGGTALRASILALTAPTKKASKIMNELGFELSKNEDGSINLMDTFGDLKKSIEHLDKAEQAEIITKLVGREAATGLMAILNASEEDMAKLTDATTNYTGAAKEMADTMNNNLKGNLNKLKSAFSELLIVVGEHLLPIFTKVVEKVTDMINWFGSLDEGTQKIMIGMGLLTAAVGPVLSIGGKLLGLLAPLAGGMTAAGTAAAGAGAAVSGGFMAALAPLAPVIGGVAGVLAVGAAGFYAFKTAADEAAVLSFDETVRNIEGLSEATQNMVIETVANYDSLWEAEQDYFTNTEERSKQHYEAITEQLDAHFIETVTKQDENYAESRELFTGYIETLSEEEKKYFLESLAANDAAHQAEKEQTLGYYEEATALLEGMNSGKIEATEENLNRLRELQNLLMGEEIEASVAHGEELAALKGAQYDLEQSATAENASKLIKSANDVMNAKIEAANAEFEEVKSKILMTEGLTEENKKKMIEIAENKKNDLVKLAAEEKSILVEETAAGYSDMYKVVDLKTGDIKSSVGQFWTGMTSDQDTALRKMNQDLGLGYNKSSDVINKETKGWIVQSDSFKTVTDENTAEVVGSLDDRKKAFEEQSKAIEEGNKKASKAVKDGAKDIKTANEGTGKSADKAGEKVDALKKKYEAMNKQPDIKKTITINEKVNKAPKSAFTDTSKPRSAVPQAFDISEYSLREMTGFNPTLDSDFSNAKSALDKTEKPTMDTKKLESKLEELIEVTSENKQTDLYIDKYTLVGSIAEDMSRELAKGVRR